MITRRTFIKGMGAGAVAAKTIFSAIEAQALTGLTFAAAGDIASSPPPSQAQQNTAALVQSWAPDRVLILGDCQYNDGTLTEYQNSYDLTWGHPATGFQPYDVTRAAPGDHDWNTANAGGFLAYWGRQLTYRSFDRSGYHIIQLDSRLDHSVGSVQYSWLVTDFAATTLPVIAYWAHPRWSSGAKHGPDAGVQPFWDVLYDGGSQKCKLILNGHEHLYERFGRMKQDGSGLSATHGIRQITVGTGGAGNYTFTTPAIGSQVRWTDTGDPQNTTSTGTGHGVLKMTLNATALDWAFYEAPTGNLIDSGSEPV